MLALKRCPSQDFLLRGFPANQFRNPFCEVRVPFKSILQLDPNNHSIPLADQKSYEVLLTIYSDPAIKAFSEVARCYQGEINLSTLKSLISTDARKARLLKGVEIGRYGVRSTLHRVNGSTSTTGDSLIRARDQDTTGSNDW